MILPTFVYDYLKDWRYKEHGEKFVKEFGKQTLQPIYKETPIYHLKYITDVGDLIKTTNTRVPR